jgi:preprotein translocase SecE subunit
VIAEFGSFCLILALTLSLAQAGFSGWGRLRRSPLLVGAGQGAAVAAAVALAFLGGLGSFAFWALGRNEKTVDFLIATEGEMKKVNWSTRREIVGSTTAVIFTAFFLALFCWVLEIVFVWFFQLIRVLDVAPT